MFRSRSYSWVYLFVAVLLAGACQRATSSEYTKYENDAAVPRISAADAKKEIDAGNAVLVDSRGETAWEQEHLPGAVVIPFGGADDDKKFDSLPKGKKIIVYCS